MPRVPPGAAAWLGLESEESAMPATATLSSTRQPTARFPIGELDLDRWMNEVLNRHPALGFALGVVQDGRLAHVAAHGPRDVETCRSSAA